MGKMTEEEARQDFLKRIENYKIQYEPLNDDIDDDLSYIKVCFYFFHTDIIGFVHFKIIFIAYLFLILKVINAGRSFYVHNVNGHVQSRVVYFLMNIHLLPRSIYLTRVN